MCRHSGASTAGGGGCGPGGAAQAGGAGTPSGAVTRRRGARDWRQAAASSRSSGRPSRSPMTRAAAARPAGEASAANAGSGITCRVAWKPAQMITAATAAIATWRAVSPARILSGRSTSEGMGTGPGTS